MLLFAFEDESFKVSACAFLSKRIFLLADDSVNVFNAQQNRENTEEDSVDVVCMLCYVYRFTI